jgi:hypothetical protein
MIRPKPDGHASGAQDWGGPLPEFGFNKRSFLNSSRRVADLHWNSLAAESHKLISQIKTPGSR